MYNLYSDKSKVFECSIKLEGASLDNAKARLIIESSDINIMFNGSITDSGLCTIPIKKLKNVLPEGFTGTMKLEVIADDTYFCPWSSECDVKASKSIQVEVKTNEQPVVKESNIKVTVNNTEDVQKQSIADRKTVSNTNRLTESEFKNVRLLAQLFNDYRITKTKLVSDKKLLHIMNNFIVEKKIQNKQLFAIELKKLLK